MLYLIKALTYPRHQSAVDGNPLAGSTPMRGSAIDGSFPLTVHSVHLLNTFVRNFSNTIDIGQRSERPWVETFKWRYINSVLHYITHNVTMNPAITVFELVSILCGCVCDRILDARGDLDRWITTTVNYM